VFSLRGSWAAADRGYVALLIVISSLCALAGRLGLPAALRARRRGAGFLERRKPERSIEGELRRILSYANAGESRLRLESDARLAKF